MRVVPADPAQRCVFRVWDFGVEEVGGEFADDLKEGDRAEDGFLWDVTPDENVLGLDGKTIPLPVVFMTTTLITDQFMRYDSTL